MGIGPGGLTLAMTVADLDLELDVFAGPFDLLIAVLLREEVDLLEVELGEVVVAYVEHLEREGELELEVATEFLVLIASLLELKSRLLLPGADPELEEMGPEEAVEELLARLLEYRRYRAAAASRCASASRRRAATSTGRRRCRRACARSRSTPRSPSTTPSGSAPRSATCWPSRRRSTSATSARPSRWSGACGPCATRSPAATSIDFDEQFGGEDRLTQAVTLFALLELYRKGEVTWKQSEPLGPIEIVRQEVGAGMSDLSRTIEALLFLSPQPVAPADLAEATEATEGQVAEAIELLREDLAEGRRGRRPARGLRRLRPRQRPGERGRGAPPARQAAHAAADPGAGRDPGDRRLPAAGLAARGGADPRRLLGVGGADAGRARPDRGVRPLAVRRRPVQDDRAVRTPLRPLRASTSCPTRRSSTRRRRTSASCASDC